MNNKEMVNFKIANKNISIAKENIEFVNGLAVIEATIKEDVRDFYGMWSTEELTYKGVINQDYNFVYGPFAYAKDIEIFPNDNIVVNVNCSDDNVSWTETRHYQINQATGITKLLKKLLDYERINDNVVRTSNYDPKKGYCTVLYDIISGKNISYDFSSIGEFKKQENGEILALATEKINFNDNPKDFYDLICYINEFGEIRTPLLCTYDNSITVFNTDNEYEETKKLIKKRVQYFVEEKEKNKQKVLSTFWKIKI